MFRCLLLAAGVQQVVASPGGAGDCDATVEPPGMQFQYSTSPNVWTLTGPAGSVLAGSAVTLTLNPTAPGDSYMGINIYCDTVGGSPIGAFTVPAGFHANFNCGGGSEGLTHSNPNAKATMSFTWTSPTTSVTGVTCRAIVLDAKDGIGYWHINLATQSFNVVTGAPTTSSPTTERPTNVPTTSRPTTLIPTSSPTISNAPTTSAPSVSPTTSAPSISPTTSVPSVSPTTSVPSVAPTPVPSVAPTSAPSAAPSAPSVAPTTSAPSAAGPTSQTEVSGARTLSALISVALACLIFS